MANKTKTPELPTIKAYNSLKAKKSWLKVGSYGSCLVPFGAELAVHWNEWFQTEEKLSLGLGFGMLLVSTLATMTAVMKKDDDFMKKYSPLFYVAVILALWAGSFLFLASIMQEMGMMLMYCAFGVVGGAVMDEVSRDVIEPKMAIYKEAIDKYGLTEKAEKNDLIIEQAKKDQAAKKAKRQAIE